MMTEAEVFKAVDTAFHKEAAEAILGFEAASLKPLLDELRRRRQYQ